MTAAALLWPIATAITAALIWALHPWQPRRSLRDHTDGTRPGTTLRTAEYLDDYTPRETP